MEGHGSGEHGDPATIGLWKIAALPTMCLHSLRYAAHGDMLVLLAMVSCAAHTVTPMPGAHARLLSWLL